jgi:hypothetical protein
MGGVDRVYTVGNRSSFFDRSEWSGPLTDGWLQTKVNKSDWGGCVRKKLNQPNLAWHFQFLGLIGSARLLNGRSLRGSYTRPAGAAANALASMRPDLVTSGAY